MDKIFADMNDYNLYADCQCGFSEHRGYVTQLLHFGDPCDIIYFDLTKTFDQESRRGLAVKLEYHYITLFMHRWISCFLSNRFQLVMVGTSCSNISVSTGWYSGTNFICNVHELFANLSY